MTHSNSNKPRRTFAAEFKAQLVALYYNGKRECDIVRKYTISAALLDKWIKQFDTSGSFKKKIIIQLKIRNLLRFINALKNLKWKMIF